MKTSAKKVDGGWMLNGSKLYITNAPIADFLLVAARTGSGSFQSDSISLFIVELPHPGLKFTSCARKAFGRPRPR